MNNKSKKLLLEIRNISKYFDASGWLFAKKSNHAVKAVDDVSIPIFEGENLGLVGESGSGKSTLGKLVIRLLEPTKGTVHFQGNNIFALNAKEMHKTRRHLQIIFQDPLASLNPHKTIRKILSQPFFTYNLVNKENIDSEIKELLEKVGLIPPEIYLDRYPHQLSGGQRQRVCIARAIAFKPKLIVADEPVSSLDMSIRDQILDLLKKLQNEEGLTYLFVSHDLNVVRTISQRVAVMYMGKIVEVANVEDLFEKPFHPYTMTLLASTLKSDPLESQNNTQSIINIEPYSYTNISTGCRFRARCPYATDKCRILDPELEEISEGRLVACHLAEQDFKI